MTTALDEAPIVKVQDGQNAAIALTAAKITANWGTKHDLDLLAIQEFHDGRKPELTFFQRKREGQISQFPFIEHSGDAGVGDKVDNGGNSETIAISQIPAEVKAIHFVLTDYNQVSRGAAGRFGECGDLSIELVASDGQKFQMTTSVKDASANCIHMASIVNVPAGSAKVVNTAAAHRLPSFSEKTICEIPYWAASGMAA